MASPVDTSVKFFTHDMVGAPALSGTVGSLIPLLDALLVTGFGQQTASSVVVAGGVATVAVPAAFPAKADMVVLLAGATGSWVPLNGEQKVTVVGPGNTLKFATALPDGTATGTITMRMAPAGWAKVFSGTNKAVYRSTDVQAHGGGMYLRVDDTAAQVARVVGYESMTDVDTGVGPFPSPAQISGGGYWFKSSVASAVAQGYVIAADSRYFIFHSAPYFGTLASITMGVTRGFGDGLARRPAGDAFAVFLNASLNSAFTSSHDGALDRDGAVARTYAPRTVSGLGSATAGVATPYCGNTGPSGQQSTLGVFPGDVAGELFLSRSYTATSNTSPPRADLPGMLWVPQSNVAESFKLLDRVAGTGEMAGRTLLALNPAGSSLTGSVTTGTNAGVSFLDVTGPWR